MTKRWRDHIDACCTMADIRDLEEEISQAYLSDFQRERVRVEIGRRRREVEMGKDWADRGEGEQDAEEAQ
jgi:hypothetical protein